MVHEEVVEPWEGGKVGRWKARLSSSALHLYGTVVYFIVLQDLGNGHAPFER